MSKFGRNPDEIRAEIVSAQAAGRDVLEHFNRLASGDLGDEE